MSFFAKIFGKPAEDSNRLTPFEVGIVLAESLIEGHAPNEVSTAEAEFLESAHVSHEAYVEERFLFNASATAFAIDSILPAGEIQSQVASGFKSWFADNAARSPQGAKVTSAYAKRMPSYVDAARKDGAKEANEIGGLSLNEVDFVFGDSLLERATPDLASDPSTEASCRLLAMALGQAYWLARLEGSMALFRKSKLVG